jgi:hypothetical protein
MLFYQMCLIVYTSTTLIKLPRTVTTDAIYSIAIKSLQEQIETLISINNFQSSEIRRLNKEIDSLRDNENIVPKTEFDVLIKQFENQCSRHPLGGLWLPFPRGNITHLRPASQLAPCIIIIYLYRCSSSSSS